VNFSVSVIAWKHQPDHLKDFKVHVDGFDSRAIFQDHFKVSMVNLLRHVHA